MLAPHRNFSDPSPRRRPTSLRVEHLEDRVTPATIALVGDELRVTYDTANERVELNNDGSLIVAVDDLSGVVIGFVDTSSVGSIVVTDPFQLGNQFLRLSGGAPFILPDGFSSTGVETVNLFNAVTVSGSGAIDVTAPQSVNVSCDLIGGGGGVRLIGQGQAALNTVGVAVGGGTITTVNDGNVFLQGTGGGGTANGLHGVRLTGGRVTSGGKGAVTIRGTGGSGASIASNHGVDVSGGQVSSGGPGSVSVLGTGGSGLGSSRHGVSVLNGGVITSGGGSVGVTGLGGGNALSTSTHFGVTVSNGGVITSGGDGNVSVNGTGGLGSSTFSGNEGVRVSQAGSVITSGGNGSVSVRGTGGTGTGSSNTGVRLFAGGQITSGGTGSASVTGIAGPTGFGIDISQTNSRVTSGGGNVFVIGTGGTDNDVSSSNIGVSLNGFGQIFSGGDGSVFVQGTGGKGTFGGLRGVSLGSDTVITSGGAGTVRVIGVGGTGGQSNFGVSMSARSVITSGGAGAVTIEGYGGTAPGGQVHGFTSFGGTVTSGGGSVRVFGRGGTQTVGSSPDGNRGVWVAFGGRITAGGTGDVSVEGVGGDTLGQTGGVNTFNHGVSVDGTNSFIIASRGDVEVEGKGGGPTGAGNRGVSVTAGGQIVAGGTGFVSVVGTGGATTGNSGSSNVGVRIDGGGSAIRSSSLVTVEGTGGGVGTSGSSNFGVRIENGGQITGAGTGSVRVIGRGGAGSTNNTGLSLFGLNTAIRSTGAPVEVVGIAATKFLAIDLGDSSRIENVGNGFITVNANSLNMHPAAVIHSGVGTTTIRPVGSGVRVGLGQNDVLTGSLTLGLTDAELDRVFAGTLIVGGTGTGLVTVSNAITRPAGSGVLRLESGNDILISNGGIDTPGGVELRTVGTRQVNPSFTGTDVRASELSFAPGTRLSLPINGTTPGTTYTQLTADGAVNLNGVELVLSGAYVPSPSDVFVLVDNTSAAPTIGTFNGLPEGVTVTRNGVDFVLSYVGGDGNDVTLSVPASLTYPGATFTIDENRPAGFVVGTAAATGGTGPLTHSITAGNSDGAFAIDPATGQVTVANPAAVDFETNPAFTLTVRATDGTSEAFASVTVTLTDVNDPPVATPQSVTLAEDTPTAITLTGSDPDGDPLTYTVVTGPTNGTLSGSGANWTYTPNADFHGTDSFTFKVNDGTDDSNVATVSITVTPVNDPPVATDDPVNTTDQAAASGNVLAYDTDVDGDTLTVTNPGTYTGTLGTLVLNADGTFTFTPFTNVAGTETFGYGVTDGNGGTASAVVSVTVTDVTAPTVTRLLATYGPGRAVDLIAPGYDRVLPWFNITQLSVVFSEDVDVQAGDLALTGVNVATYSIAGFSYDSATFTATWTLAAPIGIDRLLFTLDGNAATGGVKDMNGNYLNGNTVDGTDFARGISVLPGDFDGNGVVNLSDQVKVRNAMAPTTSAFDFAMADVNGDGVVDAQDVLLVRTRNNTRLPGAPS